MRAKRGGRMGLMLFMTAPLAIVDQLIKEFIRRFPLYDRIWSMDGVLEITHVRNTGAAFSVLAGHTAVLTLLSVAMVAVVFYVALWRLRLTKAAQGAVALLLAGALGNLIDRVRLGTVTDYIRLLFMDFPVFNFADILITVSVALLMLLTLLDKLEIKEIKG